MDQCCPACGEVKRIGEFLWCLQCSCLSCAMCFISDHVDDQRQPHQKVNWRNEDAASACLKQLKTRHDELDDLGGDLKNSIDAYIESFKRKLHSQVDVKIARKKAEIVEASTIIGHSFRNASADAAVNVYPEERTLQKECKLLDHIKNVGGLSDLYIPPDLYDSPRPHFRCFLERNPKAMTEMEFSVSKPYYLQICSIPPGQSQDFLVTTDIPLTPDRLLFLIDANFPNRDRSKEICWKDFEGDLILVPRHNLNNWSEAILQIRDLITSSDAFSRVMLEVYVEVLQSVPIRQIHELPTLKKLATETVARLLPSKLAVQKLPIPVTIMAEVEKQMDFLADAGFKTVCQRLKYTVLDN